MINVNVINKSENELPSKADSGAAGYDLRASLNEPIVIAPMQRALIPTDLFMEIPEGYELQVRPRSGLAFKNGITVLNSPGTIDSSYRGNIGVILINFGTEPFKVSNGDRIAQGVFAQYANVNFSDAEVLSVTERGEGGFGHSGVK